LVQDSKKFTVQGKMERDQLVRSVIAGDSAAAAVRPANSSEATTPTTTTSQPPPSFATPRTLPADRDRRRTPKMRRFGGSASSSNQVPQQQRSARPVSLFVDGPSTGRTGLVRSSSLKRIAETSSTGTAASVAAGSSSPETSDLSSPQLESALGKLPAIFKIIRDAPDIRPAG
jgi:hypothetical protein